MNSILRTARLVILLGLSAGRLFSSAPSATGVWTTGFEHVQIPRYLYDIVEADEMLVAVGEAGRILTSPEGVGWTTRESGTTDTLEAVTFAGSQLVAVGAFGRILTSPDGIRWTSRASGTTSWLQSVTWTGDQLVAVGHGGTVLTSPNGEDWTARSSGTSEGLTAVEWTGSELVTVGWNGTVLASPDGVNWTGQSSGTSSWLYGLTWTGSQLVAVGASGTVLSSPDGVTWTNRHIANSSRLHDATWTGSQLVAVGIDGTILTSPDGVAWNAQASGTPRWLYGVTATGNGLVAVGEYGVILSSPDGTSWTNRTSGTTSDLNGLTWTGSQLVAVGLHGTILTSPDGADWTSRASGTSHWLEGVTWTGSQLVAVGSSGTILTSPDGVSWTNRTSGTANWLQDLTWTGSQLVAVGSSGTILTSPDGVSWTNRPSGTSGHLEGVTWTGSRQVAVGGGGTVLTSPDGTNWTSQASGTTSWLYDVTWTGSQLVAVGASGTILTSPDGISWTSRTSGTTVLLEAVTSGSGLLAAVGWHGRILTSPDGINWTPASTVSIASKNLSDIIVAGGQFVGVGDEGIGLVSPDGIRWTVHGVAVDSTGVVDATWTGTQLVAVGIEGRVLTSLDGRSWTLQRSGSSERLYAVTWTGSQLVAVGQGGTILTSPDGVTWTQRVSGTTRTLKGVAWTGTELVAVGDFGTVLTSSDGVTWTSQDAGTTATFTAVTWTGSQLVAVGLHGTILTSPDGVTWSGSSGSFRSVACTGSQLVAVGDDGSILTSPDGGKSWTIRVSGTSNWLRAVTWTGSQLVAVGENGTVLTSPNGASWTSRTSGTTRLLFDVTWTGSQLVAVGGTGTVLTSSDGANWTAQNSGAGVPLEAVTWTGSQLVVVGDNGTLLTSPDGVNWRKLSDAFRAVEWTGSRLVAVGHAGTILSSLDGATWTARTSGTTNHFFGVAWTGSQLVAVGEGGTIVTSPDGVVWTHRESGVANRLEAVTWTGSQLVAVGGNGLIQTSPDGVNWTTARNSELFDWLSDVVWTGSQLVAVGFSGQPTAGAVLTSPDGVTWTARTSGTTNRLYGVAWTGSQLVAVGENGTILTSPNGVVWTNRESGATTRLEAVTWTGSQLVATGGTVLTSPDGVNWASPTIGTTSYLYGVVWAGNQLVAVGSGGAIMTSPEGMDWERRWGFALRDVTWSGNQIVAAGDDGTILTSREGATWTKRASGTTNSLLAVSSTGSELVAVGHAGTVLTSPDGVSWTSRTSGSTNWLFDVTSTGSQLVAVGFSGTILTSPDDGVTWTKVWGFPLYGVEWAESQLVCAGASGTILTSPDGEYWTRRESGVTDNLSDVTWTGSQWVAVSGTGTILSSADGVGWFESSAPLTENYNSLVAFGNRVLAIGLGTPAYHVAPGEVGEGDLISPQDGKPIAQIQYISDRAQNDVVVTTTVDGMETLVARATGEALIRWIFEDGTIEEIAVSVLRRFLVGERVTPPNAADDTVPPDLLDSVVQQVVGASVGGQPLIVAVHSGPATVCWSTPDGETLAERIFVVPETAQTPVIAFHTHPASQDFRIESLAGDPLSIPIPTRPNVPLIEYPDTITIEPYYSVGLPADANEPTEDGFIRFDQASATPGMRAIYAKDRSGQMVVAVFRELGGGSKQFEGVEILEVHPFSPTVSTQSLVVGEVARPGTLPDHGSGDYDGTPTPEGAGYFASALLRWNPVTVQFSDELTQSEPRALVRNVGSQASPELLRIRPCEPWNAGNDEKASIVWRFRGAGGIAFPFALEQYGAELPSSAPILAADPMVTDSVGGLGIEIPSEIYPAGSPGGTAGPLVYRQPSDLAVHQDLATRIVSANDNGWLVLVVDPTNEDNSNDDQECLVFEVRLRSDGNIDGAQRGVEEQNPDGSRKIYPWPIGEELTGHPRYAYGLVLEGTNYGKWTSVRDLADLHVGGDLNQPARPGDIYDGQEQNEGKKQIIPVNEGKLKVLWKKRLDVQGASGVAATVYYANRIRSYDCYWPDDPALGALARQPDRIVVASEKGTGQIDDGTYAQPDLYVQNLPGEVGFNPNDEHAWITSRIAGDGDPTPLPGQAVFALRDDAWPTMQMLGGDMSLVSKPYVLMHYRDPGDSTKFRFKVYKVFEELGEDDFDAATPRTLGHQWRREVALKLTPFHPLREVADIPRSGFDPADTSIFEDRNGGLWARHADGDAEAAVYWKYELDPAKGFYWPPPLPSEPVGDGLVWFGNGGLPGKEVDYVLNWPLNPPTMKLGETTDQIGDVRNQASIEIIYDAAHPLPHLPSADSPNKTLQVIRYGADLTNPDYVGYQRDVDLPLGDFPNGGPYEDLGTRREFPTLPPALRKKISYDVLNGKLVCNGLKVEPVIGEPYFILNVVAGTDTTGERGALLRPTADQSQNLPVGLVHDPRFSFDSEEKRNNFVAAVRSLLDLSASADDISYSGEDVERTKFKALSTGNADATGHVTLAYANFGGRLPDGRVGDPVIDLEVVRVKNELFKGKLQLQPDWDAKENGDPPDALKVDNPFEERVDLLFSADMAGNIDDYEFEWHAIPASAWETAVEGVGGELDAYYPFGANDPGWEPADALLGPRSLGIRAGQPYVMQAHYFAARYKPLKAGHPKGGTFSAWTPAKKVDGWVTRALGRTSPFASRINLLESLNPGAGSNFVTTMIQAAGGPARDVALTPQGAADAGLIAIYQTILNRGLDLSLNIDLVADEIQEDMLLAAGKLSDLYMLLGNEAVADAADPTIPIGDTFGLLGPGSVHAFMGFENINSLHDEELAMLRGRHDVSSALGVTDSPVYNRIAWYLDVNTALNPEAAAVYFNNYNLGSVVVQPPYTSALDVAAALYPMGHGDAWGHYLSGIRNYYNLLRNPNFEWIPRKKVISVSGGNTQIDRFEERRFAEMAVDRARAGLEILKLTHRKYYLNRDPGQEDPDIESPNPDGSDAWQGYKDKYVYSDGSRRAWGVDDWACRVGQGSYLDWVMGNALLPETEPDPNNVGINRLDRSSVTELNELARVLVDAQDSLDKADYGLNPLGIPENSIPFDIDAQAFATSDSTHFDEMLERARRDLVNAYAVFRGAQGISEAMRQQFDATQNQLEQRFVDRQNDYRNRLIEAFGYPYPQDPSYPEGYDGPDILHFMYVDPSVILNLDERDSNSEVIRLKFRDIALESFSFNGTAPAEFDPDVIYTTVEYERSTTGYGFVKPRDWTQPRKAPGEIQLARSDVIQARGRFERAIDEYDNLISEIEDRIELLAARTGVAAENYQIQYGAFQQQRALSDEIARSRKRQLAFRTMARRAQLVANAVAEGVPSNLIFIAGFSNGGGGDFGAAGRSAIRFAGTVLNEALSTQADNQSISELGLQQSKEEIQSLSALVVTANNNTLEAFTEVKLIENLLRRETSARLGIYSSYEALQQTAGRYRQQLARGLRLFDEYKQFRQRTSSEAAAARYRDLAFRVFRDEKLEKYRAHFDHAAVSLYQAALAYDYEINWQAYDRDAREDFLGRIVRSRAIGDVADGTPSAGSTGDIGLAGMWQRLKMSWDNVKPNLRIENTQQVISLRTSLLRIDASERVGGEAWRAALESFVVDDLGEIPEFEELADFVWDLEPDPDLGAFVRAPEPGIVIPLPLMGLDPEVNAFGWPWSQALEDRFLTTSYANKIISVRVDLIGLSSQAPTANIEVFLLPAGQDVLRNISTLPSGQKFFSLERPFQSWKLFDRYVPDPVLLDADNDSVLDQNLPASWIPSMHFSSRKALDSGDGQANLFGGTAAESRRDTPFAIRRYEPIKANHDNVTQAFINTDARLIGRSVWNTKWLLVIPGGSLDEGNELNGVQDVLNELRDIKLYIKYKEFSN